MTWQFSSPTALANNDFDEDELEAELEELEREGELEEQKRLDQEFLDVGPSPAADLPEVPSTKVPSAPQKKKQPEMSEEEKELAELAAFASLELSDKAASIWNELSEPTSHLSEKPMKEKQQTKDSEGQSKNKQPGDQKEGKQ